MLITSSISSLSFDTRDLELVLVVRERHDQELQLRPLVADLVQLALDERLAGGPERDLVDYIDVFQHVQFDHVVEAEALLTRLDVADREYLLPVPTLKRLVADGLEVRQVLLDLNQLALEELEQRVIAAVFLARPKSTIITLV